jgi:NAD(P)-dependent dehydrogenase (short-subunit alcohol dehydrogenase family)
MPRLKDQVAIVSGSSSGIGKTIAEAYAAEGARVVLAGRNMERLNAVADGIRRNGGVGIPVSTDVLIEESIVALFQGAMETFGRVDILVNSAGVFLPGIPTDELTLGDWSKVLAVNLTAAFLCSREGFKIMKRQGRGKIINIGSTSTKNAGFNAAAYTASKFGLDGLTRSMALDGCEYGVAVSIINPGNTDTPVQKGREEKMAREGVIATEDLAKIATLIATLPDNINLLDSLIIPLRMPFLGRG